ncbi:MAG: GyrI-like domain-containing protein [Candidatus Dormibacteraeota bacterium]|nr:GyrI-like domain-containing protein [Candidatus Dormibacteraeota bacterium]
MSTEPRIVERTAQPYVAITAKATMQNLGEVVPPLNQEVFGWLAAHGAQPSGGPPFWKYNVVDMERGLEIEAGVTTRQAVEGDGRVHAGFLPAGRYATLRHVGHPMTLMDATARLLRWADEQGLKWDVTESPDGERWTARLEFYLTDPREQPDMNAWEAELAFRLADGNGSA